MFTLRSEELRPPFNRHRYLRDVRVAVLDLGSTSFRLVVADWDPGMGLVPRVQRRKHLNLGMVVGREGRIPESYASTAVKAVTKLRRRAELSGTDRIVAGSPSGPRESGHRGKRGPAPCVVAGGTVRALARLMIASGAAGGPLHGLRLATVDIEALGKLLLAEKQRLRCRIPGMDRHRVAVLGAGSLVLIRLLRRLDL